MTAPSSYWPRGASSVVLVLAIILAWIAALLLAPAAMAWFTPDPHVHPGHEGPVETVENVIVPIVIGLWLVIAYRHRANRRAVVLAALMALQFVLVLGEETDWGQNLGLRAPGWRNLRMEGRAAGLLEPWNDALVPTAFFLFFMLVPLVPLARVRRWLERAAPVRAEIGDGVAVVLLPPMWIGTSQLVVPLTSVELIQIGAYAITLNVAIRILRAPIQPAP
jgi:hypothetical protein